MTVTTDLQMIRSEMRASMSDHLFGFICKSLTNLHPVVIDHGTGVFAERLDWNGAAMEPQFRRVRVMARQTYVFAHAAIGGLDAARPLAAKGARFLLDHCRSNDGQFLCRVSPEGALLDATHDLYDIAFGLFALAWWYRLSGEEEALDAAAASVRQLGRLRTPSGHGYIARAATGPAPYQQNPHMHLFEAALFLGAFSGRQEFRDLADELFCLAEQRLFVADLGILPEFFDADWQPDRSKGGIVVEPGHHYEWAWLLSRYGALSGNDRAYGIASALFDFAHTHGHDPATGLIFDAVDERGRPTATDFRIWPNLEYLKAQIALREQRPDDARVSDEAMDATVERILRHFLSPTSEGPAKTLPEGLWIDYLDGRSLLPRSDHIPVSTLYHIMFAFTEFLRHRAGHAAYSGQPW